MTYLDNKSFFKVMPFLLKRIFDFLKNLQMSYLKTMLKLFRLPKTSFKIKCYSKHEFNPVTCCVPTVFSQGGFKNSASLQWQRLRMQGKVVKDLHQPKRQCCSEVGVDINYLKLENKEGNWCVAPANVKGACSLYVPYTLSRIHFKQQPISVFI
ncbi:hypothetical protein GGTG_05162 [Gaeumannomyces tritici R3-111a-1]|uniref:Uncharacterized protein n=1 Tax=Gaeumannomyces tritici (strain R3-111a-1) TaxID=644352 RepID=J3NV49_GAET3|nr:hypothetical protein GGTG_05162 [Gaeumannomyces tritici R3-111a-1]EJT75225.1 hypothetical protein GGTG_05162 [Gaeumannomyces tritici R3-111a-1]